MSVNQGKAAKDLLKEKEKTQEQFAEFLERDRNFVTRAFKKSSLNQEIIEALSKFLAVTIDELEMHLNQVHVTADYVQSLKDQLEDKERIIAAQEGELEVWRKLEKERSKGN